MLSRGAFCRRATLHFSLFRRPYSNGKPPLPWRTDTTSEPSVLIEENYAKHTMFTVDLFRRFTRFTFIGLFALGITSWTAFEGAHMWVEKVELARDNDGDVQQWEWDQEAEKWSGGSLGGTDAALGFKGRHAVRSAWIAQNWGTGSSATVIGSNAFPGRGPAGVGGLNAIEARLRFAQDFLSIALSIAESKYPSGQLRPETFFHLLSRHAGVLERMGTKDALFESRSEYERVWSASPGKGIDAARVALKLGDLNYRLGDSEDALSWWTRSIQLAQSTTGGDKSLTPMVPAVAPSSPLAQRTLTSTLVSLSAFYSTSGQLQQAQAVQKASLDLLRSIPHPESIASGSPAQALHALYLLHRSSLISIHLAEVLFGLRDPPAASISWLHSAAQSAERVALALSGLPLTNLDAPESKINHPPSSEAPLLSVYTKSRSMSKPAKSLLRDARRTAAEAWNLIGILSEDVDGTHPEKALQCYERALGWVGVSTNNSASVRAAGEAILESEWKALWSNYVRAREAVHKSAPKN